MPEHDPDAELVLRVGRGEPQAVRQLVARKLPRLLSLAQRMLSSRAEAEEVAQEVFVRAWKQAPEWRTGDAKFDTWLHRVTLNLCYDRLRARKDDVPYDESHEREDESPGPEGSLRALQATASVAQALAALPHRQREAIVLQYYQDLSNPQAAALMNITVEALESLLARARRTLRARLAGTEGK